MKNRLIIVLLSMITLNACQTTTPQLIQRVQPNDHYLTCNQLQTEMVLMRSTIKQKDRDHFNMILSNVILVSASVALFQFSSGIYRWFIPIPILGINLSDGIQVEIKSATERYAQLQSYWDKKWCTVGGNE